MAQAMVNFRMDETLKKNMEKTCKKMGLTVTAAYTMFATKVTNEQRIPFEITADPFYSKENMDRLRKNAEEMERIGGDTLMLTPKSSLVRTMEQGIDMIPEDFMADGRPDEIQAKRENL